MNAGASQDHGGAVHWEAASAMSASKITTIRKLKTHCNNFNNVLRMGIFGSPRFRIAHCPNIQYAWAERN